ncbi:hypothetical protein VSDG_07873 [Cytospora chrysosperma]|uniref:Uncharacterized protein n=1 Tax=Cytospora chrysosperma TaxID=252740 RepID=A0A423VJJ7_CYTCH|nr:hypothetical protein VSDG_07873 [Valsa sordida]
MRFVKIFTALAAIAGITTALQDIETRGSHDLADGDSGAYDAGADGFASDMPYSGTAFLRNRAAPAVKKPTSSGGKTTGGKTTGGKTTGGRTTGGSTSTRSCRMKKRGKPGDRTRDVELVDREWRVYESGLCPATQVEAGQTITVTDVSGCSGLFFFSDDGKTSAYHITAGREKFEGRLAARSAKEAKTTDSYSIYAMEQMKIQDIEAAIKLDLPNIKQHETKVYSLDELNSKQRFNMHNVPGTKAVAITTYECE